MNESWASRHPGLCLTLAIIFGILALPFMFAIVAVFFFAKEPNIGNAAIISFGAIIPMAIFLVPSIVFFVMWRRRAKAE